MTTIKPKALFINALFALLLTAPATHGKQLPSFIRQVADQLATPATPAIPGEQLWSASTAFDAAGQPLGRTVPAGEGASGTEATTLFTFDPLGRVSARTDALGNTSRFVYDAHDQLTRFTDAKGQTTTFAYDTLGRMTQETRPEIRPTVSAQAAPSAIQYQYDQDGPVGQDAPSTITDPLGNITRHRYDAAGQRVQTTLSASGQATPEQTIAYEYDAAGRLLAYSHSETTGQGAGASTRLLSAARYTRDALGRKTGEVLTYGAISAAPALTVRTAQSYDADGNTASHTYPDGTQALYLWTNALLQGITLPNGQAIRYSDFTQQLPTRVQLPGWPVGGAGAGAGAGAGTAPTAATQTLGFDPLLRLTQNRLGAGGVGGAGGVTSSASSYAQIYQSTYQYDRASNVRTLQSEDSSASANTTTTTFSTTFSYDLLNRLSAATPSATLTQKGLPTEAYTLDPLHNRVRSAHQSGAWVYNAQNQLVQWGGGEAGAGGGAGATPTAPPALTTYTFDANGNTQTRTRVHANGTVQTRYTYDASQRLREIAEGNGNPNAGSTSTAQYRYDPFGRRISKTTTTGANAQYAGQSTTTWFVYSDQGLMAELDASGIMLRAYGWSPDQSWGTAPVWQAETQGLGQSVNLGQGQAPNSPNTPTPVLNQATTPYYYFQNDHLGTPRMAIDQSGQVAWRAHPEAFGKAHIDPASRITVNLRLPGQYYDAESGMHQNWFRDYDPDTGRYLQADPIGLGGGENFYGYVGGNPLSYADSLGLFTWAGMPTVPQGAVDFGAGLGDSLLLGAGGHLRDFAGVNGGVDPHSAAYGAGAWSSFGLGGGRLAYAGIAKVGSLLAASGAEASAFRQGMKALFRFGAAKNWRPPDLTKYPTDAALRAAAGRTNLGINGYGAGVAGAGAAGAMNDCR
jgi:RHS repeat-associated protein